jgi:hypothetical protein
MFRFACLLTYQPASPSDGGHGVSELVSRYPEKLGLLFFGQADQGRDQPDGDQVESGED